MEISKERITSAKSDTYIARQYDHRTFASPRHYHDEYEIILIEESSGRLFAGNTIVPFKKGDLFMFAPNMVHCFKNEKSRTKRARAAIVLFRKDFLGNGFLYRKETVLLSNLLTRAEQGILFQRPPAQAIAIMSSIQKKEGLAGVAEMLILLDLLSEHRNTKLLSPGKKQKYYYKMHDRRLSGVFAHVEKHIVSADLYQDICTMTGMSSPSFSRFFRQKTGKTFTRYLNEVRIAVAQKMLTETNKKIETICAESGFVSQVYFNRVFRKTNGMSPGQYRRIYERL